MNLRDLLNLIDKTAQENNLSKPYIVGGIPRNILLGNFENLNDIDITTGDESVNRLAELVAKKLGDKLKVRPNGQKSIIHNRIKLDFSTNFRYDDIDKLVEEGASELDKETYSRDFTINTLLMPLDFSKIIDLTGKGRTDLKDRIISCPAGCGRAFKNSPNRILRALYLAAKQGFTLSNEAKEAIKDNAYLLKEVDRKYASDKITQVLALKPEWLDWLLELGVMQNVPLTKTLSRILIDKKKLLDVL